MILDVFLPKLFEKSLLQVDLVKLKVMRMKGIILDLDNTLVPWGSDEVSPEVLEWLRKGKKLGLKFCIISNATKRSRFRRIHALTDIPIVPGALKPIGFGFRRAMALMKTEKKKTAVIGDQIFADIWGANRLQLYSILVAPMTPREFFLTKLVSRNLEKLVWSYFRKKGKLTS